MSDRPWDLASDEVQLATWRAALEKSKGNISLAAKDVGIGRATGTRLTTKFELKEFAAKLRIANGAAKVVVDGEVRSTGRPRKA